VIMAGYSGRSVVQKLGIKPGFRIFVDGAPASYDDVIGPLLADVTLAPRLRAPLDMAHVFATQAAALRSKLPACRDAIAPGGMVWVSWPKNLQALRPMSPRMWFATPRCRSGSSTSRSAPSTIHGPA
jgi:hypothetical protein